VLARADVYLVSQVITHTAADELAQGRCDLDPRKKAPSTSATSALTKRVNFSAKFGEKTSKLNSPSAFYRNFPIGQAISQVAANRGRAEGG